MADYFIVRSSQKLFEEAKQYMPGGVNSPVRAFRAVGGEPLFIRRGAGPRIYDEDGNEFTDYVLSWGALILGHAHPRVVAVLKSTLENGTSFGAPTRLENILAKMISDAIPSVEMIRFVNSGTEAVMSAIRLARAFTGRDKVIKFAGCYHGHSDGLLAKAGSGAATLGLPDSPGVPISYTQETLVASYNNLPTVERLFESHPKEIAAVIIEPVAANMGIVPPKPGFLEGLRQLTEDAGAVLIFDEVIAGFRLCYGSAQSVYGVSPDLVCLGKIIGGGLPIGAYAGRREIMEMVAPLGSVYQAGTLSGNPLAMAAGIETLNLLGVKGIYQRLERQATRLAKGIKESAGEAGIPIFLSQAGSMITVFFTAQEVTDYATACSSDPKLYAAYFNEMLRKGIYLPPSQFEAQFLSLAHGDEEIEDTIAAVRQAFSNLAKERRI
ncbi:glutamate-1-semialdehyde 2,1-aminomutase [Dehalococcoidia bacterium]|nr:glutamate-1-semialdehyde 2,1-aminomutase [Dehalococcoidia bacterium]